MKKFISALFLTFTYSIVANASFSNLNFENGRVQSHDPAFGFLDWEIAVPGWNHSDGDDTSKVYYGLTHVGVSQWFLLNDINLIDENGISQVPSIHQGNYSLSFASGNADSLEPDSPFVNASISQTGMVPTDAKYIQLLAEAPFAYSTEAEATEVPFEVSIGNEVIPMLSVGEGLFRGDISNFSGLTTELKITNISLRDHYPIAIDNITFTAVPLPASIVFLISGLLGLPLVNKRSG